MNIATVFAHHPAKLGPVLAVVSLPFHLMLSIGASHDLAALLLALIAGVYVGFAVQDGRGTVLATESGGTTNAAARAAMPPSRRAGTRGRAGSRRTGTRFWRCTGQEAADRLLGRDRIVLRGSPRPD